MMQFDLQTEKKDITGCSAIDKQEKGRASTD